MVTVADAMAESNSTSHSEIPRHMGKETSEIQTELTTSISVVRHSSSRSNSSYFVLIL